jgi:hypothetical protein
VEKKERKLMNFTAPDSEWIRRRVQREAAGGTVQEVVRGRRSWRKEKGVTQARRHWSALSRVSSMSRMVAGLNEWLITSSICTEIGTSYISNEMKIIMVP